MKRKIFIDVDGVITNSVKRFCDIYNEEYKNYPDFVKAKWENVETWNFTDECPLIESVDKIEEIFNMYDMYEPPEWMKDCVDTLFDLTEKYDLYIVTMGSPVNLGNKFEVLKNKIPFIDFIGVNNNQHNDKRKVDMSGAIFIDDVSKNLHTSNAYTKICFGDIKPWNEDWTGKRCFDWKQAKDLLL